MYPSQHGGLHGYLFGRHARVRDVLMSERARNGEDKTLPLLLLPGTLCDERVFGPLQERLPGAATRVVLTTEARSMRQAAEQVLAQAPERFALLGFSLGGMVAMETALCAPERVRALALVSTTPSPVPVERHRARREAVQEARALGLARFVRERLWPEYGGIAALLPLLEAMAQSLGHAAFARQTEMALGRQDYRCRLAGLSCPALVMAGTEDRLCPPAVQREFRAALPGCMCVLLPGAGHLALLEQPDEVASAVAAWFDTAQQRETRAGGEAVGPINIKEIE